MALCRESNRVLQLLTWLLSVSYVSGAFSPTSKNNVVVYYGQGPSQKPLSTYCADASIDVIVLSFVYLFPQQANGFPGIDFGNQCYAETYPAPGYRGNNVTANNHLLKCPNLAKDLYTCRKTSNKKILLSLGGATSGYQLTGASDGNTFAALLWALCTSSSYPASHLQTSWWSPLLVMHDDAGDIGPRQASLVAKGYPRPFDYNNIGFTVDGFDLDIEHPSTDSSAGYKALVQKLRTYYAATAGTFYLTASPQCVVPDANLKDVLSATAFDMLFIQYYNTPQCSARRWATANPSYKPGATFTTAGFTYDAWTTWLAGTPSRNARLYITLPGSDAAASPGNVLTVTQASNLLNAYYCRTSFGGVAVWEATYAAANVAGRRNFYQNMKVVLNAASTDARQKCATTA